MLVVDSIHTYYGESHILQGVSLKVEAGELVALLGRNGAGKTTTMNSIIGFNRPRVGKVLLSGRDMTGFPPYRVAAGGVGLVPQGRRIFAPLTVKENLVFAQSRTGPWTLARVIGDLKQSGIAMLLAEQNLAMALSVADRCYVLNKGQVVVESTAEALRQ